MKKIKIVCLGGSMEDRSSTLALMKYSADRLKELGADVYMADVKTLNLPIFSYKALKGAKSEKFKTLIKNVKGADGFIFASPEYHGTVSSAFKNAIDFLFAEWNNKAAGFVGYGSAGGARAVEHLRLVMAEVQVATVRNQVALSLFSDFENYTTFKPDPRHEKSVGNMLDQLLAWSGALQTLRSGK